MGTGNQTPVLWQSKITLNYWTVSLALQFQVKRPPISVHGILNVPYWAYHYYLSKLNTFYDLQICGEHYIKMNGREQNELLKLTIDSKICKRKKTIKLYFTYKHQDKIKHYFMQITSTSSEAVCIFPLRELFSASVSWFTPSLPSHSPVDTKSIIQLFHTQVIFLLFYPFKSPPQIWWNYWWCFDKHS